jgi:uncharacterized repeat protein (TIGR03803 family)
MLASDGNLYGLTSSGGVNNWGTLFQYNPLTSVFTKKIDFNGTNGGMPYGSLMQATDGKLYGLTSAGGTNSDGVLFQYDFNTNILITKFSFSGAISGKSPNGDLMQSSNGKLYGLTNSGGVNAGGVLFEFDITSNTFTNKKNMGSISTGQNPCGSLTEAPDGNLYGVTSYGGANNFGVLFQYDPVSSTYSKKIDFSGMINGKQPRASLMLLGNKLYGMTYFGGTSNIGVMYQYDFSSSTLTKKIDFGAEQGNYTTSLINASDGNLYCTNQFGGSNNCGTLFKYDPFTQVSSKLVDFGDTLGYYPSSSLLEASDGNLYGVTVFGGSSGGGVLFQYNPLTNTYTKKVNFIAYSGTNEFGPNGTMIQASDGKLYGTTVNGGAHQCGVLFQYDLVTNTYVKKIDFDSINGRRPFPGLIQASDGNLYGMTYQGGLSDMGALFQYNPVTNVYTKKVDFMGSNGSTPYYSLIQGNNGKLYGTTSQGGANNFGVLFQFDIATDSFAKKIDFDGVTKGAYPSGALIQAATGKLVGTTANGGVHNVGVLFQLDPVTNAFTKTMDFDSIHGSYPDYLITIGATIRANSVYATYCAGSPVSIPYTIAGTYQPGNVFTAQLSDASGSFASPVNIGSVAAVGSGILNANLPGLTTTGTGYRVRIVSTNPIATGSDNGSNITINTCADVWPGDANSDGTADNLDVLELGLHYLQTGAPRATISNNWQSHFAGNWTGTITNGKNLNHSDCNGDGTINDGDTLAIYNNYGLTHAFKPAQTTTVNPQLSIVPDQPMVVKGMWGTASVYLGNAATPINNLNGLAFTVDFDQTLIEPNNIYLEYQNSFMDAGQNLHFRKLDFTNGKLFTASTHTLSNNVNGFGKIATLHYQILSSLSTDEILSIGASQVNQSDASGIVVPLTSGTGTLMVIGASVGVKESLMCNNILVSPNPTNGILNISFNTLPQNTKIELYNSIGALVLSETMGNKTNLINTSGLSSGMYFIKVLEGDKVIAVKKIVKE